MILLIFDFLSIDIDVSKSILLSISRTSDPHGCQRHLLLLLNVLHRLRQLLLDPLIILQLIVLDSLLQ